MFLEFKDSFYFQDIHFDDSRGWFRDKSAVSELNNWIDSHKDYAVKIISYRVSNSKFHDGLNQTHIFVEATKKEFKNDS